MCVNYWDKDIREKGLKIDYITETINRKDLKGIHSFCLLQYKTSEKREAKRRTTVFTNWTETNWISLTLDLIFGLRVVCCENNI